VKIFFMHIPKTAGSSFRRFLERSVREAGGSVGERVRDGIWSTDSESYPSYAEFCSDAGASYRDSDLLSGHYPFHVADLLPPETHVVTVLRDPLERVVSHAKHQMELERQTGARIVKEDVNDFLEDPHNEMFLHTIGNLALKYLAGREHPDAVSDEDGLSLEEAVVNASRTQFGFVDELAAFQQRLSRGILRGSASELGTQMVNRSQDRFAVSDLSMRNRDLLCELTELDRVLDDLLRGILQSRILLEEPEVEAVEIGPQRGSRTVSSSNFPGEVDLG
jgi:hypothetical protein